VTTPVIQRCLVANRGEIAVRVIRALRQMGIGAVAVYSEADAGALHVRLADEAVPIGPAEAARSYLDVARIVDAARRTGCDAVHPGYGFLSENADFPDAVTRAGLIFVGPSPGAIRAMGDKVAARRAMAAAGVPVVPGVEGEGEALLAAAAALEPPLIVKAAAGGGGKGMRRVDHVRDLAEAVAAAQREAARAFGDGRVFVERYVAPARHVEIQVLADRHGGIVHLGERECSVQRRHQKIVEEAPSPLVDAAMRRAMGEAAVRAARAAAYENAGTVEFVVDPHTRAFYFLEMNTRLQVEHAVTEMVYGVDLVRAQLRVAMGEPLWLRQEDLVARGHAIECRVYAEDVEAGFLPAPGPVLSLVLPGGPGVRVDAGVAAGDVVSIHYDPMIAKVVCWDETRAQACGRALAALDDLVVLGLTTNVAFLKDVLRHELFRRGEATTAFVAEAFEGWRAAAPVDDLGRDAALIVAALAEGGGDEEGEERPGGRGDRYSPWSRDDGFRAGGGR
jgi:acetyl-CoA carboxylase biotin carboxylase subunit